MKIRTGAPSLTKFRRFSESQNLVCYNSESGFASEKSGSRDKYEKLWRNLFADPLKWWDNRLGKPNARCPDFKHKETGDALWVIHRRNPPWVASEISSIRRGVSAFSRARRLSRYNKAGQYEKTIEYFKQMQQEGIAVDGYDFVHILNACAALKVLEEGRRIHRQILETGCTLNLHISSSLVDMYAKCGSLDEAWIVFKEMPTRDTVAWTAMILGCVKCGESLRALDLFQLMQKAGVDPTFVTFVGLLNACASIGALKEGRRVHEQIIRAGFECGVYIVSSLIDMYAKCGSMEEALKVFNKMPTLSVVSWNAMILGYVKSGEGLKALELFKQMQRKGIKPESRTFVAVLNACASIAALQEGKLLHEQIIESGNESDVYIANGLIHMYAKCGSIDKASIVFDKMQTWDSVSLTTMIMGYAMHGLAKEAVATFEKMSRTGLEIDEVTFICLLTACNHGGLVKEGMQYFRDMWSVYGVPQTQEHYTCMVDILGRAGRLADVEELIKTMPFEPSAATWVSLLGACRIHGNVEMGKHASRQLLDLDPLHAGGYVLLSNIYAASAQWATKLVIQKQTTENSVPKLLGRTWIEVNNEVHSFGVNDSQHPQILKIHEELKRLAEKRKKAGFVPDTRFALHNREEEKMVYHLCHHSEKLAIAFGLISTPSGSPLLIVKNLRVCGSCHSAAKFISKIVGRVITIRDANRFHHFKDGLCSCGEYW